MQNSYSCQCPEFIACLCGPRNTVSIKHQPMTMSGHLLISSQELCHASDHPDLSVSKELNVMSS